MPAELTVQMQLTWDQYPVATHIMYASIPLVVMEAYVHESSDVVAEAAAGAASTGTAKNTAAAADADVDIVVLSKATDIPVGIGHDYVHYFFLHV